MLRLLSDEEVVSQFGSPDRFITEDGHASAGWEGQTLDKFRLPAPLPLSWDKQRLVTHARCHRALRAGGGPAAHSGRSRRQHRSRS